MPSPAWSCFTFSCDVTRDELLEIARWLSDRGFRVKSLDYQEETITLDLSE